MRENRRPKAQKPARYRDSPQNEGTISNQKAVDTNSKSTDLRTKLTKQRKRRREHDQKQLEVVNESMDLDESNFCPDYESCTNNDSDLIRTSDNSSDKSGVETDKDTNNNANKVKSVVVAATSGQRIGPIKEVRQRITFSGQSEAEEGEISSSDNPADLDSFMEQADDSQLAEFLKKHQDRIQRITEKSPQGPGTGEESFLT